MRYHSSGACAPPPMPMGTRRGSRRRRRPGAGDVARAGTGKRAVTRFRVLERFAGFTYLECRLETGRTHQIRVHMAYVKHPLIGDPLYGGSFKLPKAATEALVEALRGFRRQALHAEKLSFTHPVSGDTLSFESPLPADMVALIDTLRDDTRQFNAA